MIVMDFFKEALSGSLQSVASIAIIVIPLMIILQLAKDFKILDWFMHLLRPVTRFLGMSDHSAMPLLVGLSFGLSYGAGVIIQSAREGALQKRDLVLLVVFLGTCHAIFEDTMIFVAVGANGWLLLSIRVVTAITLTYVLSKRIDRYLNLVETK